MHCQYLANDSLIPYDRYDELRAPQTQYDLVIYLIQYITQWSPPDALLNDQTYKNFIKTAEELALTVNDYMNLGTNNITNGIISYAYSKGCSMQSAIDYYYDYIKRMDSDFHTMRATIMADSEYRSDSLDEYLESVMNVSFGLYSAFYKWFNIEVSDGYFWSPKWNQFIDSVIANKDITTNHHDF
ncbi:unnamed protein product [Oppiella nova]|uniref:Uncharacterized protein n=1 Tax=Oppiella nova TaxID=334625 RepID=A0A7R9R155_9ACAR|nr:unnamed protein product [Oppiella nova]CAG2183017.1 unnamed protein product [Oppiella nova]